jgi:hypothetical protein
MMIIVLNCTSSIVFSCLRLYFYSDKVTRGVKTATFACQCDAYFESQAICQPSRLNRSSIGFA